MSSFLHNHIKVGDRLTVGKPAGAFTRRETTGSQKTTVLLSSGIGLTPVLSMLHEIAAETDTDGNVIWIHGARNGKHHSLKNEVEMVSNEMANKPMKSYIVYSRPEPNDKGLYDFQGRIKADLVLRLVHNWKDAAFFMCGPLSFLADLQSGLERLGVDSKNIHYEAF